MATLPNNLERNSNKIKNEWILYKEEKFGMILPEEYK